MDPAACIALGVLVAAASLVLLDIAGLPPTTSPSARAEPPTLASDEPQVAATEAVALTSTQGAPPPRPVIPLDFDNDGVLDTIRREMRWSGTVPLYSRFVVLSGAGGAELASFPGPLPNDLFGWVVATPGDLDADGVQDFYVGAPGGVLEQAIDEDIDGGGQMLDATNDSEVAADDAELIAELVLSQQGGGGAALISISYAPRTAELRYDYRNQMVEYDDMDGGHLSRYAYDCFGRRIAKTTDVNCSEASTVIHHYVNGGQMLWQVLEEYESVPPCPCGGEGQEACPAPALTASFVYGLGIDEVVNMRRDVASPSGTPEDYFFFADDLGNVTCLTDSAGTVVERYRYGDYGLPTILDAGGGQLYESAFDNTRMWNGREFDRETAFYYYRTRYLEPTWGRFTTRDTIGTWGDPTNHGNSRTLVGSNPWTHTDPTGQGCQVRGMGSDAAYLEMTASATLMYPGAGILGPGMQGMVSVALIANCRSQDMAVFVSGGVAVGAVLGGMGGGVSTNVGFLWDMPSAADYAGLSLYGTVGATLPPGTVRAVAEAAGYLFGSRVTTAISRADQLLASLGMPATGVSFTGIWGFGAAAMTYRGWEIGVSRGFGGDFIGFGLSYAHPIGPSPMSMPWHVREAICDCCGGNSPIPMAPGTNGPSTPNAPAAPQGIVDTLRAWGRSQRASIEQEWLYTPLGAQFYDPFDDSWF